MGMTYHLVCEETRSHIWIGQQGAGDDSPRIYLGESDTMDKLEAFLVAHVGKALVFVPDNAEQYFAVYHGEEWSPGKGGG